jgi:hypothetical protein
MDARNHLRDGRRRHAPGANEVDLGIPEGKRYHELSFPCCQIVLEEVLSAGGALEGVEIRHIVLSYILSRLKAGQVLKI